MGLISYFKGVYYDHIIEKADQLLQRGYEREAEEIYKYLLGKQHSAVSKLADLYYSQCIKAGTGNDTNKEITLFNKIKGLESQGGDNYDVSLYNSTVDKTVKNIKIRATFLFDEANYQKCYDLMTAINVTNNRSSITVNLACEANIMLLIFQIRNSRYSSKEFKLSATQLSNDFNLLGKSIKRCEESVESFVNELISNNRFLSANYLLENITNKSHKDLCLTNAGCIVDGKDEEASANDLKETVSKYGIELVLKASQSCEENVRLFNQCWNNSPSHEFVIDVLNANKTYNLQREIISNILANHSSFLSKGSLKILFIDWIQKLSECKESLNLFEKIHLLGYNVKDEYLKKLSEFLSPLKQEDRILHINHSLSLFPNDTTLLLIKLDCARWFVSHNKNNEAISLCDEIGNIIIGVDLVKSEALFNNAKAQPVLDIKVEILNNALNAITPASKSAAKSLIELINELFIGTAELYYTTNEVAKAYSILHEQSKKGSNRAITLISDHRYKEIQTCDQESKEKAIECVISEIKTFGNDSILSVDSYQMIWDELIAVILKNAKNKSNQEVIAQFENLISRLNQEFSDRDIAKQKKSSVLKQLIQRKYLVAREKELSKDYTDASNLYREISVLEAKKSPTLAALRFVLCKLKDSQNSNILEYKDNLYSVLRKASDTFSNEKKDIAYRFALLLLRSGEIDESLAVLSEFLPEEVTLKKACEQVYIENALAKLDEFNHKLDLIKNRELSSDDTIYFTNHMLEYAEAIKPALEISQPLLVKYRNKIKNYAISKLFDEGKYSIAFEKLKKEHSDYLNDLTDLRNIAIVCLNIAESGQLSNSNYKEVISVWLTAIYQEQLFIKSLDYTSWDNNFTFSLHDAYGHFNEGTVYYLPDNVNLNHEGDDKLVMIKEVQRYLLDRFEASISNNQQYHLFLTDERNTMDSLIALNLDVKCKLVAPYLATLYENILEDITDALEHERKEEYNNWEDVLAVGAEYKLKNSIYSDFTTAKIYYDYCISALDSKSTTETRSSFTESRLALIRRFNKKYNALISYTSSKISSLSADNKTAFKNSFDQFSIICNAFKENTLSYSFSNFVIRYVVEEVNENRLSKEDASGYILTIHLLDRTNTRVSKNLENLLPLLFQEYVQEGKSSTLTSIKSILSKTRNLDTSLDNELVEQLAVLALISGQEERLASLSTGISSYSTKTSSFSQKLKARVSDANLNKQLNEIVQKVNDNTVNNSTALAKVYDIYVNNSNNSRVCQNLVTLCDMCIMQYIVNQAYGSSSVKTVLNKLKNNMSVEFKNNNDSIRDRYYSIWNQLDSGAKRTLSGIDSNNTLNSKGEALREGLDYMRTLGCISNTSRLLNFL